MQTIPIDTETDMSALGARIAEMLAPGMVVGLSGDLGAGKTTLVRGILQHLCGDIEVPSPTYTIVQTYDTQIGEIWHCDMYRLQRPEDAYELGLLDAFEDAICLIEWPDKLGSIMPDDSRVIKIEMTEKGRSVTLTGWDQL